MARKSKSAKNGKKTNGSEDSAKVEVLDTEASESTESTTDTDGVVIEAEAVDVTISDEVSPEEAEMEKPDVENEAGAPDSVSEADVESVEEVVEDAAETVIEEPVSNEVVAAAPPPETSKSSPVPLVFGGLIAGGLGYLAATMMPAPEPDTSAITESVTAVSESVAANLSQLETLASDISALKDVPVPETLDLSGIETAIGDLTSRFDNLNSGLESIRTETAEAIAGFEETSNALSDRLTVLETAGPGESEEAEATAEELAAFRAELEKMTDTAEQRVAASLEKASEIETAALAAAAEAEKAAVQAEQEAAEAAALAEQQAAEATAVAEKEAAIAAVRAALESGGGFEDQLAVLGDVPDVLSANAETGVTPLVDLQQSFAGMARNALSSAETIPQDASAGERFTAFLKQRTNARSLTPKEGNSVDAVLSRAEGFVKQGDLGGALVELDALGDDAKAVMQSWLDQANTRQAAIEAANQLSATN